MKRFLLGTFIRNDHVPQRTLKSIVENFGANRIFIFSVEDEVHKRLITFNANEEDLNDKFYEFKEENKNTVRLHRRKDINTFYTINSLNQLIIEQNGKINPDFQVDWKGYDNSCLVVDKEGRLKVLKTKLAKVIDY